MGPVGSLFHPHPLSPGGILIFGSRKDFVLDPTQEGFWSRGDFFSPGGILKSNVEFLNIFAADKNIKMANEDPLLTDIFLYS